MSDRLSELHPLELQLLGALPPDGPVDEAAMAARSGLSAEHVRTFVSRLIAREALAIVSEETLREVVLSDLGREQIETGPPELQVHRLAAAEPRPMPALVEATGLEQAEVGKAVGALKKAGILSIDGGKVCATGTGDLAPYEAVHEVIRKVASREPFPYDELTPAEAEAVEARFRKRGKDKGTFVVNERTQRAYALTDEGRELQKELAASGGTASAEQIGAITPDMLKDGSWKDRQFRTYNVRSLPPKTVIGRRHPYRQFLDHLKERLVAMGFEEMRGSLVENEFWNMDALFMPQFHSARDIHDAYFLENPSHARELEEPFASQVAAAHENGGDTGSRGWGYAFDRDRSRRLVLRSQGTALSARTLASKPKIPGKYFGIARCFRYDQVDATHAPDFFQVEGIILGEDMDFRTLLGLLKLFAVEIAQAEDMRFTPAYFPFTEPSVEVHIKHPRLGYMEMGGAGLFRHELTRSLGIDVPVIAWGLGIDRMAMVALGIDDIRDLFSTDLEFIRSRTIGLQDL